MSPQKKKKLEAAIDNLFSGPKKNQSLIQVEQTAIEPQKEDTIIYSAELDDPVQQTQALDATGQSETIPEPVAQPCSEELPVEALLPAVEIIQSNEKQVSSVSTAVTVANQPAQPAAEMAFPGSASIQSAQEVLPEDSEGVQMVIFTLDGQYYGIGIDTVDSIIKMQAITELPHAPYFIVGLTNLRGKVLPVISLRKRFGIADEESTKNSRIIVINVDQKEAGLIVDGVSEVETIPRGNIEAAPSMTGLNASRPIDGIAKLDDRLIILLNLTKVILPGG